ncbi:hypothetical protein B9Z55_027374 [Caenorhabditis nigoni]|nr:hypothetical protein B9Z55_027374 [Caenorhabditis nigoni]
MNFGRVFFLFPARELYMMIAQISLSYFASKTAENLIRRLRIQRLKKLLYQDGEFYDDPENTPAKIEKALIIFTMLSI